MDIGKTTKLQSQINTLKNLLAQRDIPFKFTASANLCELVLKNEHPNVKTLPDSIKALFLGKMPFLIDSKMVINYLEGNLDEKNKWILDNGTVASVDNEIIIIKEKH